MEAIVAIKVRLGKSCTIGDCITKQCVIKLINVKLVNMPPNFFQTNTPEWFKDKYQDEIMDYLLRSSQYQCGCLNHDAWDEQTVLVMPDVVVDLSI